MSVLVVVEIGGGEIEGASCSAVAAGVRIGELIGSPLDALAMGDGRESAIRGSLCKRVSCVYCCEAEVFAQYSAEGHASAAAELIWDRDYRYVVAAATPRGNELMSKLAKIVSAEKASDVIQVEKDRDGVVYTCLPSDGNSECRVRIETRVNICTVVETAFDPIPSAGGGGSA